MTGSREVIADRRLSVWSGSPTVLTDQLVMGRLQPLIVMARRPDSVSTQHRPSVFGAPKLLAQTQDKIVAAAVGHEALQSGVV